ncbi:MULTISPECIES: 1-deoxy-D-xylulose-5-phosphate synthase [unclassified Candidatus Frackibacter]|uniref:1-deoxy-D-xylulose-5-phosphate synthase n=1 Tax=unclassified Candidatus Frackibacter TaxID=2648818 RepID=UPI000885B1AA|nr:MULTISPECIES: 1-deoxy-D-xylulose-5-phosphate synthase [unclassified Candidatus Frackibacter]SDC02670.1 1-deoxy-D-xylulose-5-phosphate synthase [Candidatus Frackibacter sp. WG11]SEM69615.1 1-deoxy-D-xylulose-5-phosphate synthase [Candidatus Frackibacter sp. WG12]SFL80857.1 1-deoxy-D-xylulose-5-phosphate synthase [Candidatus Frackibacter sp. WG13]
MTKYLRKITSPQDLQGLSLEELEELAEEIRKKIIVTLSKTGGHLASSLGVVELTIALHTVFDSPSDKIIWDVGHQAYAHKLITGRYNAFSSLRQYQGLSGFPKRSESKHDILDTGHSSTSISAAVGMACARDLKGENNSVTAVIGDGALTGGMAFEALNHAGHLGKDLVVVLNDNEMSIAENVGAVSNYLTKLRTEPMVHRIKGDIEYLLNKIPAIGGKMLKTVERVKDGLKYLVVSGVLFEEFGFTYLGPIDGHNLEEVQKNLEYAKKIKGPVMVHTITTKGKGYPPAEKEPENFHGTSPFDIKTGESKRERKIPTYTQIFSDTLIRLASKDNEIVGITAAMPSGTGLDKFNAQFPDRFYDVGIAEQHAVTFGTGLALNGAKPVITLYSTFLQRAYDQVVHDVALQEAPVTLAIDRAGLVGRDGETHQGVFDYSYLRHIPNLTIMAPKDENELQHMLKTAINHPGPASLRYSRGSGVGVELDTELKELEIGKAEVLKEGSDIVIFAIGSMVVPALEASKRLAKRGIEATVVNSRFVKPLDEELILKLSKECGQILTVEEQVLQGGFGSAILELLADNGLHDIQVNRMGIPDEFVQQGEQKLLLDKYDLNKNGIMNRVTELVG